MSWLIPERKCWSASALTSSGVDRTAGEWSQVQVSDVVTGLPKRWEAEAARPGGGEQLVAGFAEVLLDGGALVVVEHVAFGADGRALDDLAGLAGEVQRNHPGAVPRRQWDRPLAGDVQLAEAGRIDLR